MTLAVAATLFVIGVPGFSNLILDSRRTARVNAFSHAVHLAKNEAVKRRQFVVICKTDDGIRCGGPTVSWGDGWLVFVNEDNDRPVQLDPGEPVVFRFEPTEPAATRGNRAAFTFTPNYRRSTNGTLVFCDRRGAAKARAIIVSYTGRPRLSARDSRGRPLTCP